jgi:6-phosphogluconolactonase
LKEPHTFEFDGRNGNLRLLGLSEGIVNPSFLVINQPIKTIYAVNELKTYEGQQTGTVSAFRIGKHPWELQPLNIQMTMGTDPCHISLDKTGKFAAVANFRSGSITIYPIKADGSLGTQTISVQHSGSSVDPKRQAGPHAHAVVFDSSNRYLLVPDLGLDKVMVYTFDQNTGLITFQEKKTLSIAAGSGPRYLEQHPSERFFYLVNELSSTITVLRVADGNFSLEAIQNISTLPDGYSGDSTCADLHVSPSGKFLYASNRGHDSIAMFQIDRENGLLSWIGSVHTKGKTPRNFAIDPDGNYLLVANQDTDNIVVFSIDSTSGLLKETGIEVSVPTPVCIQFAPIYLT